MNALVWLSAALKGDVKGSGLHEPVYKGNISEKASIRIEWPGYKPYAQQVNIRRTSEKGTQSITIIKFIQEIAKQVQVMIKEFAGVKCTMPEWDLSPRGSITFDQIVLLEVRQVSLGSFQPILAVARQCHSSYT
ncbi:uncharacterized protein LAESUDRAFT_730981 [Laetiporus sulphureus 93-53]|uniref:Uncharacterized protein n=1 Tax=Laetiporus sulphureus 93-53 TaxID=1314785 RepID=A0A165BV01_9APHY|nr:uncharacterized protein LAESUDRAFT_730981 [Laetiporus sulphureus 93-53]KZT01704.1 hypothetical protein LAESUDRAFT_730981 [Laetiporus sulphureus 93-53]